MARPKKQPEQHNVVREWRTSPVVYGPLRSKSNEDIHDNAAYHPPFLLTSKGIFLDESMRPVDPKIVPDYIKAEAKRTNLSTEYVAPKTRELNMAEAMLGAGVQDTEPDRAVRAGRRAAVIS